MSVKYFPNRTHLLNASMNTFQFSKRTTFNSSTVIFTAHVIQNFPYHVVYTDGTMNIPLTPCSRIHSIVANYIIRHSKWAKSVVHMCTRSKLRRITSINTYFHTFETMWVQSAYMRWRLFVFCLPPHFCFITTCVDFVDMLSIEWCARKISGYAGRNEKFSHFLCRM